MVYEYQLRCDSLDFKEGVKLLKERVKNRVIIGAINNTTTECIARIVDTLSSIGIPVNLFNIDKISI